MNITLTVLIGNSDNKLTQFDWSDFCESTLFSIQKRALFIHFKGYTNSNSMYQSACFVCEIDNDNLLILTDELTSIKYKYNQQSIAILTGYTHFI